MMQMAMPKEPSPPVKFLLELRNRSPSRELSAYLSTLKMPKELSLANFIQGVQAFLDVANLTPEERKSFYGSELLGLHYNTTISDLLSVQFGSIGVKDLPLISPASWGAQMAKEGIQSLIYKGDKPSHALDELLKGPSAIDCGMFCQLAIWFGIRHVLGNQAFDTLFGKGPFYITQFNYDPTSILKPYIGSPLFSFLRSAAGAADAAVGIRIEYVQNVDLYGFKHPGGESNGDNCIVLQDENYTCFSRKPKDQKAGLSRARVDDLLYEAFNAPQDDHDAARLALYLEHPETIHPRHQRSYGALSKLGEDLAAITLPREEWRAKVSTAPSTIAHFDFTRFQEWVSHMQSAAKISASTSFSPLTSEDLCVPAVFLRQIPIENREQMSFGSFELKTQTQHEIYSAALQFCEGVMHGESRFLILTGTPGIGKTAAAVSCAKELISRGKKTLWFSEVTLAAWTSTATDMQELLNMGPTICNTLALEDPDVIILDDDNLAGSAGRVLLEELNRWYLAKPGRALLITSNEPVSFDKCYGHKLDGPYDYPPLAPYGSPQYANQVLISNLAGTSLRARADLDVCSMPDAEKMDILVRCNNQGGRSAGIMIDPKTYEAQKHRLGYIEWIPAFSDDVLFIMRQSSKATGGDFGPEYHRLSEDQKRWLKTYPVTRTERRPNRMPVQTGIFDYMSIRCRSFESTQASIIACELLSCTVMSEKKMAYNSISQLLLILNYAHDQGSLRVILINKTGFSHAECIEKIKQHIQEHFFLSRDAPRSLERLDVLLHSTAFLSLEERDIPGRAPPQLTTSAPLSLAQAARPKPSVEQYQDAMGLRASFRLPASLVKDLMLALPSLHPNCERKKNAAKLESHHPGVQVVRLCSVLLLCDQAPIRLLCDAPASSDSKLQDAREAMPTVFSPPVSIFFSLDEERHHHPALQHEFDKRYGLMLLS